jgi:hypothetical protein
MMEGKVKNLNIIVQACSQAITRREELFKRLTEIEIAGATMTSKTLN